MPTILPSSIPPIRTNIESCKKMADNNWEFGKCFQTESKKDFSPKNGPVLERDWNWECRSRSCHNKNRNNNRVGFGSVSGSGSVYKKVSYLFKLF
jgi:hypothetical protein